MHRARRAHALGALSVVALALTAGCTFTNPQTTTLRYDPADGQDVDLGPVDVDSLLVVAKAGTTGPGTVIARLSNSGTQAQTVTLTGPSGSGLDTTVDVPAGGAVSVGPRQKDSATMTEVGVKPGGLVTLTVAGEDGKAHDVRVPVLTSTQPEFATLVPTPTPTPTPTPVPLETATPSESAGSRTSTSSRATTSTSSRSAAPTATETATSSSSASSSRSTATPSSSTGETSTASSSATASNG